MVATLEPIYDERKSFYGKANFLDRGEERTLYSYETEIMTLIPFEKITEITWSGYSHTTMRHIREFLQQNGFGWISKEDWNLLIVFMDTFEEPVSVDLLEYVKENKVYIRQEIERASAQAPVQ